MQPKTAADLQAVTVGPLQPLNGKIVLSEYDPAWPQAFAAEAANIRRVLGNRVRVLEHVGSTSVPGLAAKPVIDIVLAVDNAADETAYVPDMETAGYVLRIREPEWYEHRVFKGPAANINLHVFSTGCPEVARMILFRDWLRTHAADRERYTNAKRELAERDWAFVQNYADAKTQVVEEIVARAAGHEQQGGTLSAAPTD
ncbi:MAG: GrpB family protein [Candidatus Eremiobacteraeota bacterium]|nr:GrpB family protein [Candidatus Eremiobacteraeota bacterium]